VFSSASLCRDRPPAVAVQDKTFEMERKRNRPEKYDRNLLHKTVTAVEKVTAVSASTSCCLLSQPAHLLQGSSPNLPRAVGAQVSHWTPIHAYAYCLFTKTSA